MSKTSPLPGVLTTDEELPDDELLDAFAVGARPSGALTTDEELPDDELVDAFAVGARASGDDPDTAETPGDDAESTLADGEADPADASPGGEVEPVPQLKFATESVT